MSTVKRTTAQHTAALNRTAANGSAANRTMDRPSGRRLAEALGAMAVLVVGLVGIPALLAAIVGWPLPHQIPTGSQLTHAMGTSIPDSFWPHLFATLAWLAWAYFTVSVTLNLVAQLQGRRRRRRRRLFPSTAVSTLVAAVMVLGQLRGIVLSASGSPVAPLPALHLVAATAPATAPLPVAQPAPVTHTVVPGDTLWGIATKYYGDGTQWQAIYQANVGLPQPGGGALSDAHWIYPGWTLVIPAVVGAAASSTPATPTASNPVSAAAPAPTPAPVPAARSNTVTTQPTSVAHVSTQQPADTRPTRGGQRPPTTSATSAKTPGPAGHPVGDAGSAPHPVGGPHTTAGAQAAAHGSGDEVATVAIGAGIFGLAAIGVIAALDRRRRRQSGRRARGGHIPRPKPNTPLADLELELRHYAQAGRTLCIDQLAELLGQASADGGSSAPDVLGVEVRPDALDVIVAAGSDTPSPPFESVPGSPRTWRLPNDSHPHGIGDPPNIDDADVPEPIPLVLATVGQDAAGMLLVNLARYRTVHIDVDADLVPGTLAAMATELAGVTAVTAAGVIAVGFGWGVVDRMENGTVIDDLEALPETTPPGGTTIILVDAGTVTETMIERILDSPGLRLVLVGPGAPGGSDLRIDPAQPSFDSHDLCPIQPPQVMSETFTEVQTLLDLAEVLPGGEPEQPPPTASNGLGSNGSGSNGSGSNGSGSNGSGSNGSGHPGGDVSAGPITIGLLGEPTIAVGDSQAVSLLEAVAGTAGTKARRVEELLIYLASHDGAAGRGQWLTDISPDKALSDGYIRNLVLLTRRSLEAITGEPDLLGYERTSQRLALGTRVSTDWSLFQSLVADDEPEDLRTALSLVRGMPFGANPEPWTSASGISYSMADSIADAAIALGEQALSIGDAGLAVWAARQGQLANRYDQNLWRILLRAAGDRPGVQRVWEELHALLAVDGEPAEDLDPATVDLFNALNLVTSRPAAPQAAEVVVLQDDDEAVIPTRQAV